ncbi:hypothetical protein [Haloferax sp. DFSO60]|uniref:hypothetical protein n=1 Tax=Haloferax sp. DFSO60 TaxID=3388652 RepID=UPI00397D78A5
MNSQKAVTVAMAVVGLGAILVGIQQELLHIAPVYEGTIETGWGGRLNHEERMLAQLGCVGVGGAVATLRWKYAAVLPLVIGGVELGYPLRAVFSYARDPGLYTVVQTYDGTSTKLILGAEPFLLVTGGLLLLGAGIVGWRSHTNREGTRGPSADSPALT